MNGMRACAHCGGDVADTFRYCPWCAAPQRRKLVEFFRADPRIADDRSKALRVSRYLDERHARLSIWEDDEAAAAISIDESEAARLSRFLAAPPAPRHAFLDSLRAGIRRRRTRAEERETAS